MRRLPLALLSLAPLHVAAQEPPYALIGMTQIEDSHGGLAVGGLSGIDYDPASRTWLMISDDRSEHGPARWWRARIAYDHGQPPKVDLLGSVALRGENGAPFAPPGTGAEASDGESIRVVPGGKALVWASEGDARDGFGSAVRRARMDGTPLGKLPLPAILAYDRQGRSGPRPNLSFEGLSFADGGRKLWVSVEAPLYQDGPLASPTQGATVRFSQLAYPSGRLLAQMAYKVDPIGPVPAGRLADNGVSEILALDARHLLVIERSGVEVGPMDFRYRARVYCAATDGASDVAKMATLQGARFQSMRKTLAIDLSGLPGLKVDNVEGVALGPVLSNGHASLVFITDNNFAASHATQLIVFEIAARGGGAAVARALCRE